MTRYLVTGAAGFIGFHLARLLLDEGAVVHGYDGMTDYYDVDLKQQRNAILEGYPSYSFTEGMLEDSQLLETVADEFRPDVIIHLAAQAGVRYSLENPRAYVESTWSGPSTSWRPPRARKVRHLLMASTSSVYGANKEMPFAETDKADTQLTIYAATKKANESMAHSYVPTSGTSRPRCSGSSRSTGPGADRTSPTTSSSTRSSTGGRSMSTTTATCTETSPTSVTWSGGSGCWWTRYPRDLRIKNDIPDYDSLSPVAPFRVVNIGNSDKVKLLDFIDAIEDALGLQAIRNCMPMQPGDVHATWADSRLLRELTGFEPTRISRTGSRSSSTGTGTTGGPHEPTTTPDRDHGRRVRVTAVARVAVDVPEAVPGPDRVTDHAPGHRTAVDPLTEKKPILICNEDHRFIAAEQMRGIDTPCEIILEPVAGTPPPRSALAALRASQGNEDPLLLVLAADHLIEDEDGFRQKVESAEVFAEAGALVTFGVVPRSPETGHGYIRRGEPADTDSIGFMVSGSSRSQTPIQHRLLGDLETTSGTPGCSCSRRPGILRN